jgi:alkaline phosphatase D
MGGHGYAAVKLTADAVECEFVCIPRPARTQRGRRRRAAALPRRAPRGDVASRRAPRLEQRVVEGDPGLAL